MDVLKDYILKTNLVLGVTNHNLIAWLEEPIMIEVVRFLHQITMIAIAIIRRFQIKILSKE